MRCAIWYHLCNLKIVKNTHGDVLLSVKSRKTSHICIFFSWEAAAWSLAILQKADAAENNFGIIYRNFLERYSFGLMLTKCNQIRMKQRGFGNIYKNFHFLLTQPWNFSYWLVDWPLFYKFDLEADTVQKWSFSFKISSVNMKKSLTENFISCAVRGVFRGLCQTSMMDLFCRK